MKRKLSEILVSPCCRLPLELRAAKTDGEEIEDGELRCGRCGTVYPIRAGIPRFVPDDGYAAPFTFEWRRHGRTQLDEPGISDRSAREMVYKTGFGPADFDGAFVLDAGVGMGRFADVAERQGAEVVGFDLSGSVDVARDSFGTGRRIHLVQADLYRLPFREGVFDLVYSIGVLNHTPDARAGFLALAPLLKPGGSIAVSVYGESRRYWYPIELWRRWTTRLRPETLYRLARFAALRIYPLERLFPPLGLLLPIPAEPDADWRVLNTFNLYAPRFQSKHSYWEVWQWHREAGLESLEILPHMVSVRGRRPRSAAVRDQPRPLRAARAGE